MANAGGMWPGQVPQVGAMGQPMSKTTVYVGGLPSDRESQSVMSLVKTASGTSWHRQAHVGFSHPPMFDTPTRMHQPRGMARHAVVCRMRLL